MGEVNTKRPEGWICLDRAGKIMLKTSTKRSISTKIHWKETETRDGNESREQTAEKSSRWDRADCPWFQPRCASTESYNRTASGAHLAAILCRCWPRPKFDPTRRPSDLQSRIKKRHPTPQELETPEQAAVNQINRDRRGKREKKERERETVVDEDVALLRSQFLCHCCM